MKPSALQAGDVGRNDLSDLHLAVTATDGANDLIAVVTDVRDVDDITGLIGGARSGLGDADDLGSCHDALPSLVGESLRVYYVIYSLLMQHDIVSTQLTGVLIFCTLDV